MEKIGIICEYNPFHNGHIYHLTKIKELYPDSLIILIVNGYFMQRGEVSIITKEDKVKLSLEYGIDIVIELPTLYSTQSADTFAYRAIESLNKLKIDKIVFGSETNDIEALKLIAQKSLTNEDNLRIRKLLNEGLNYPTALAKSLDIQFNLSPNDLLGISYIKAILKVNPNIIPIAIQRTNDYLDLESNDEIISASNIRNKLKSKKDISKFLPPSSLNSIIDINEELIFKLLCLTIIRDSNLDKYLDVVEGIEYRLLKVITKSENLNDLIKNLKSKRYTYIKLNRMLIHILLGITKEDAQIPNDYLNILGFNQKGRNYLNDIKKILPPNNQESKIRKYELRAAYIYGLITNTPSYKKELENKPIIL